MWEQFCANQVHCLATGIRLDFSRVGWDLGFLERMSKPIQVAVEAMTELEKGAIANPDENRMVGHYWLRDSSICPDPKLREEIDSTLQRVLVFGQKVTSGQIVSPSGRPFCHVLCIGIGGSALGPQFVAEALSSSKDQLRPHFLDNTDPDGFQSVLNKLASELGQTLVLVISKSGGTPETFNGMKAAQRAFQAAGLDFAKQTVAITGVGSKLDQQAKSEGWLETFPMWDWVGGRTSVMSAVGLVPAALQGLDIGALLDGAKMMDRSTRCADWKSNPALALALAWYYCGEGQGRKDMVILPYKDRLALFSKYLQQLIMESLGKEKDLQGQVVHQGIAVYGNKGSTDQHAYVQQLRDGVNNFFATFIVALQEPMQGVELPAEQTPTSGDYLCGFWMGTRQALHESGRQTLLIKIPVVSPQSVGALIALYERAVGFYASLVGINAYHQPGVEAGKKAAQSVLDLHSQIEQQLKKGPASAPEIAEALSADCETVFHICEHLSANGRRGVQSQGEGIGQRFFI